MTITERLARRSIISPYILTEEEAREDFRGLHFQDRRKKKEIRGLIRRPEKNPQIMKGDKEAGVDGGVGGWNN